MIRSHLHLFPYLNYRIQSFLKFFIKDFNNDKVVPMTVLKILYSFQR